jgi:hypothetical protein
MATSQKNLAILETNIHELLEFVKQKRQVNEIINALYRLCKSMLFSKLTIQNLLSYEKWIY